MSSQKNLSKVLTLGLFLVLGACKYNEPTPSQQQTDYQNQNGDVAASSGQLHLLVDALGSLSLEGLAHQNIMPVKLYNTALLMAENETHPIGYSQSQIPVIMKRYGFINPTGFANWQSDKGPEPQIQTIGYITTTVEAEILGQNLKLEIGNLSCAVCHTGLAYDKNGDPTTQAWMGTPNSSLNLDGYFGSLFKGLQMAIKDEDQFMQRLQQVYPQIDPVEVKTIQKFVFPRAVKEIKKLEKMGSVLPFKHGGPGNINGLATTKKNAGILDNPYQFHKDEVAYMSAPALFSRGFRSSLTVDGSYANLKLERFRPIDAQTAESREHQNQLADLAAFFTFSVGNILRNIVPGIPDMQNIFWTLKDMEPQAFPGVVNSALATKGSQIFANHCTACHGTYTPGIDHPKLLLFPNKLISQDHMGTDPHRWQLATEDLRTYAAKNIMSKYVDAGFEIGGYTAPILVSLWTTAPYLHNGSVPTLWHLMHPELRPTRFQIGGHSLDLQKIGIRGVDQGNGDYLYPSGFQPWSDPGIYDTREAGRSNKGHESQFQGLSEDEKTSLLEYLKLL